MAPPGPAGHELGRRDIPLILLPRYSCGLLQIDCGGGYCCPVGRVCFNSDDDQPTCRLAPGIPGTDQPASPAQGGTSSTTTTTTSSSSSSPSSTTSSSTTSTLPTTTFPSTSTATATSTPSSSSLPLTGTAISGSGIAGIVVGVVLVATLLCGSVWSLLRRRRRERVREMAVLPRGGGTSRSRGSDDVKSFFAGGTARRVFMERRREESPPRMGEGEDASRMMGDRRRQARAASWGDWEDGSGGGMAYMYGGSNVGVGAGEVPGRAEAVGDGPVGVVPPPPLPTHVVVRKEVPGCRGERPPVYELDGSSPLARTALRRLTD